MPYTVKTSAVSVTVMRRVAVTDPAFLSANITYGVFTRSSKLPANVQH